MTAPMSEGQALLALAERVAQASGPSIVLEQEIALAIYGATATDVTGITVIEGVVFRVPAYTASLDAAMSLVPEGMLFYVDSGTIDGGDCHACVVSKDNTAITGGCKGAATPALALTAASLRARAILPTDKGTSR